MCGSAVKSLENAHKKRVSSHMTCSYVGRSLTFDCLPTVLWKSRYNMHRVLFCPDTCAHDCHCLTFLLLYGTLEGRNDTVEIGVSFVSLSSTFLFPPFFPSMLSRENLIYATVKSQLFWLTFLPLPPFFFPRKEEKKELNDPFHRQDRPPDFFA